MCANAFIFLCTVCNTFNFHKAVMLQLNEVFVNQGQLKLSYYQNYGKCYKIL